MFDKILSKVMGLIPIDIAITWVIKFLYEYSKKTDNQVDDAGVAFIYLVLNRAGVCNDIPMIDDYLAAPSQNPVRALGDWAVTKLWELSKKTTNNLDDNAVLIIYRMLLEWGVCNDLPIIDNATLHTVPKA